MTHNELENLELFNPKAFPKLRPGVKFFKINDENNQQGSNNIYVGFSVRMNRLLTNTKPDNFDNLYIPGFNRTYNGDFGIGFNYSVSYFLPLYKTKSAPKPDPNKK
mgnify:CR=1 FL=1